MTALILLAVTLNLFLDFTLVTYFYYQYVIVSLF